MSFTCSRKNAFIIVLAVWAICYLPGLGKTEFKGEEGRRTLPAVEMLKTGNWVMPRIADRNYYNKPPGINWLIATSFMLTGQQSELTARLPSVVFTLAFATIMLWLPIKGVSVEARLIGAISFLTTLGIFEKGRLIEIEAVYTALTGAAILLWLFYWSRNSSKWLLWIVPSILLGYGMLVKGPFIFIFFYCVAVAVMWHSNRLKELLRIEHFAGIFVYSSISLWWFYLASLQAPPFEIAQKMTGQLLVRIIGEFNFAAWSYTVLRAVLMLLPWLLLMPVLWDKHLARSMTADEFRMFRSCRMGTVAAFVIINLMPNAAARYSMPAVTTMSVLLGWALAVRNEWVPTDRLWKNILLFCLAVLCVTAVGGFVFKSRSAGSFLAICAAIIVATIIFRLRDKINNKTALVIATGAVFSVAALQYATYGLDIVKSKAIRQPAAEAINNIVAPGQKLYIFRPGTFLNPVIFSLKPALVFVYDANDINGSVHYLLIKKADFEAGAMQNRLNGMSPEVLYEADEHLDGNYRLVMLK